MDLNIAYCLMLIILLISSTSCDSTEYSFTNPMIVQITGNNYEWHYKFAGNDSVLNTADDIVTGQEIHLPIGVDVIFKITSNDNIYAFSIPELQLIEMAIPNEEHKLRYKTNEVMTYQIEAGQMCGFLHNSMLGDLIVEKNKHFHNWISKF